MKSLFLLIVALTTTLSFCQEKDDFSKRLKAIKKLKDEGFRVGIAFMPILPFITDSDEVLKETISKFND